MRRGISHGIMGLMLAVLAAAAWAGGNGMQDDEVRPPSSFEIPFEGPGQLATILSWGRDRPDGDRVLVLTSGGESRRIIVQAPTRVRWRSSTELLVEQSVQPVREGSGTQIVRMTPQGEVLEVLSDRDGLAGIEPSPGGQRVAVERYDQKGLRGIEIREVDAHFELRRKHAAPTSIDEGALSTGVIWNPDGSQLAVSLRVSNSSREPGRRSPRLAILSRDTPGYTRIPDSPPGTEPERGGVIPLFWNQEGIYVRTTRIGSDLLRCDPEGSGCTPVYSPGEHRLVLDGRQLDDQKALLLVKDFTVDPLEARAKEIHEINLATGDGRVILRLPDGVFVSDFDWIEGASE